MSRFILHKKAKEKIYLKYLMTGIACILTAGAVCFAVHSTGTARAKSREVVLIYTQEELEQYLLDQESEEYNRNGRYRLEEDLDLGGLYQSVGTNTEPFTGTFDGNGHVISGLARPLFGVMEHARVENLFLSETVMTAPFRYYDGEHYVDGYGALAAYAVDSVIQNCGMSGGIWTASPAEAEYQLAKASPAEAEEGEGPGMADDVFLQPDDEIPRENTGTAGPANDITDDSTTASEAADGPGAESSSTEDQETAGSEETKEPGGAESGSQEESPSGSGQSGSGDAGNITLPEDSESAGEEAGVPSETEPAEENAVETGEAEGGGENIPGSGDGSEEAGKPAGGTENTSSGSEPAGETDTSWNHDGTDHGTSAPVDSGSKGESAAGISETIGYRVMERHHLMMKIPAVLDSDAEEVLKASPSDASPSDAEGPAYDETDASKENQTGSEDETVKEETEGIEYVGNPDGDIYILVTAERVTAGGLIAQTSGTTLISDCFALVEMGSHLETVETYAGIIGGQTRIGNSYASGLADSDDVTGGFAAVNDGIIENSYSSVSVGTAGTIRDAFTALGSGSLSGCVYDRQMACAEAAKEEMTDPGNMETEEKDTATPADEKPAPSEVADFSLRGQNTADMTGPEAQIPGNWYRTANAYP